MRYHYHHYHHGYYGGWWQYAAIYYLFANHQYNKERQLAFQREQYWNYIIGWYWQQMNEYHKNNLEWQSLSFTQQMEEARKYVVEEYQKQMILWQNQQAMKYQSANPTIHQTNHPYR